MPASVIGTTLFGFVFLVTAPIVVRALGHDPRRGARLWLFGAIVAVAVSWYLPSPFLADRTSTFSQHAVGGGLASVLVTYYLVTHVPATTFVQRGLAALAVTSVLGVGNELLELGLDVTRGTNLTHDAAWDLLANTVGAVVAFLAVDAAWVIMRRPSPASEASPSQRNRHRPAG